MRPAVVALAACCAVHAGIFTAAAVTVWGLGIAPVAVVLVMFLFLGSRRTVRAHSD